MDKILHNLKRELDELGHKESMTYHELEMINELTDAIIDIMKIMKCWEEPEEEEAEMTYEEMSDKVGDLMKRRAVSSHERDVLVEALNILKK